MSRGKRFEPARRLSGFGLSKPLVWGFPSCGHMERVGSGPAASVTNLTRPTARFTEVGLVGDSRHDRSSLERLERLPPKVLRPMHLPGLPSCGLSLDAAWP